MRKEVESLMPSQDRQAQVREAGQAWQFARDRICALSSPVSSVAKQPAKPAPSAQGPVNLLPFTSISIDGRLYQIETELSYPNNPGRQAERQIDKAGGLIILPAHSGQFVGNQYVAEWNQTQITDFLWTPNSSLYGLVQKIPYLSKGKVTVTFDSTFRRILNLAMEVHNSSPNNPQLLQTLSLNLANIPGYRPDSPLTPQSDHAKYTIEGEGLCSHITGLDGQSQDIWGGSTWVRQKLVSFGCKGYYAHISIFFNRPK